MLNDVRFDGTFPMINEYCESAAEFSLVHRIVYFLLAPDQNWLKIGMSQNILTVAGRIRHIAGREPFKCHCIGLSTVREPVAHAAMRKWRIRSEWFHWCPETQKYGSDICDICWTPRDGDDAFSRAIDFAKELDHEQKVDDLSRRLHAMYNQQQQQQQP